MTNQYNMTEIKTPFLKRENYTIKTNMIESLLKLTLLNLEVHTNVTNTRWLKSKLPLLKGKFTVLWKEKWLANHSNKKTAWLKLTLW